MIGDHRFGRTGGVVFAGQTGSVDFGHSTRFDTVRALGGGVVEMAARIGVERFPVAGGGLMAPATPGGLDASARRTEPLSLRWR